MDRDRRVAGDVLLRKGHIERDCLRRDSIVMIGIESDESLSGSTADGRSWKK